MINRAPLPALDISAYTVCVAYESKYPDFTKEFLGVDFNQVSISRIPFFFQNISAKIFPPKYFRLIAKAPGEDSVQG
jgi:hypothetical protein